MKFDLHVHSEKSTDSNLSPDKLYHAAKRAGLSGVAVCDHNTFLSYPQLEDLIIIPACEYSTNGGHMLVYFLREPLENKLTKNELGQFSWHEVIGAAHEQGAVVFLAHPYSPNVFRTAEIWKAVDGIEIFNSRIEHSRIRDANLNSQTACLLLGKPFSAGSDAHFAGELGSSYWECELDCENMTREETLEALKEKLLRHEGKVYGGAASPYYRAASRWLDGVRKRQFKKLFKAVALFVFITLGLIGQALGFLHKPHAGYLDQYPG